MKRNVIASMISASLVLSATVAIAFPFGKSWHDPANGSPSNGGRAGAGGIYGMGSARDHFITCANCHINGKGTIGAKITPTPAWQKVNNQDAYKPGQSYTIKIDLTGEHAGLNQMNDNLNGFAATFEDQGGSVKGTFTSDTSPAVSSANCPANYPAQNPASGTTYVYGDCHGVIFIPRPNVTSWTFNWTAPAAGAGQLTLYYGVVDGDHNGKSSLDDDVKMGTVKLVEGQ